MYEDLFQTSDRPFRATPDVRFYFPFDSMEQTRQTVLRAVRRAEGPVAVMGGAGLGKSLLAAILAEDLADRFDVVRLHAARLCSRRAMLQNILFELQLPYRDLSEGELRLSLMERMEPLPEHAAEGLALIVDEAQTLPTKLLEELRLITNFARQGQARARLVLLGNLQLEETLALPEMSSFNQRLAARCFLQPMNRTQTADFVRHQFTCARVDPKQLITRDALENVYVASEGIPRLVNQVMDHALILAIASDQYPISAALIQEAWSDLQQLPMSWQAEPVAGTAVEFGSIDDLDQDFELEPEGLDEFETQPVSNLTWPSAGDLEDFGPFASAKTPNQDQSAPRVVFDASVMFQDRHKAQAASTPMHAADMADRTEGGQMETPSPAMHSGGDQDLFIFRDDDAPLQMPEESSGNNLFSAWHPAPETFAFEIDLSPGPRQEDSDEYQLAAWPDEVELAPLAVPAPLAAQSTPKAEDPFGQDFDEEFEVDAGDVRRWQSRHNQRAIQSIDESSTVQPGSQLDRSAPTVAASPSGAFPAATSNDHPSPVPSRADESAVIEALVVQPEYSADVIAPLVSTTMTGAMDERLVSEIEDLISQLNFSAFSVEMDTVEQISPECMRRAAAGSLSDGSEQQPMIYPMHLQQPTTPVASLMDDDRDMLVIEEEVPASMRSPVPAPAAPVTPQLSYPDLFQQLRG